jgi:hypothetical protein
MIATISSSFSVSAIANPPSRGTMIPATNAPVRIEMRPDIGIQKIRSRTENGMHANHISEERRSEEDQDRHCHENDGGPAFDWVYA